MPVAKYRRLTAVALAAVLAGPHVARAQTFHRGDCVEINPNELSMSQTTHGRAGPPTVGIVVGTPGSLMQSNNYFVEIGKPRTLSAAPTASAGQEKRRPMQGYSAAHLSSCTR